MKTTYSANKLFIIAMILCTTVMVACSDWDEFKKYTDGGEILYTGKFDTAVVFPGKDRVKFWGIIAPDPKVKRCKIYWNNKHDSVEFAVEGTGGNAPFDKIFATAEGTMSFTVYTYDDAGNPSIGRTVTGSSYGARYRSSLTNRKIKSMDYDHATTTIYWDVVNKLLGPVQMEVSYQTPRGDTLVITPATEEATVLKDLDYSNDGFSWRTVYKPLPTIAGAACIDTFQTKSSGIAVPVFTEDELNRGLFTAMSLPGDTYPNGGAGGVASMWDGAARNDYGKVLFTDIGTGGSSPQMVTFDLGQRVDLTKLIIYPFQEWYGYYVFSTLRDYEIYGSSKPSSNGALDASWTLLHAGTITKISGGAKEVESSDDIAAAQAGFTVPIDPAVPTKVRYIRIRCLRNYEAFWTGNSNAFFSVSEVRGFAMIPH